MKWMTLYNKIGKQRTKIIQNTDVYVILNNKSVPLELKFEVNGKPYLVLKNNEI